MSEKIAEKFRSAARGVQAVQDEVIALFGRASRNTDLIRTWRSLTLCALGANLILGACASGGGSSESGSPSSPPDSSPAEPDPAPPPPSSPPPPSGSPPTGQLSIPLSSSLESNLAPVEETSLQFGGAFGSGPDLGQVVAVDSFGRAYWLNLSDRTRAAAAGLDLLDWLAPSDHLFSLAGRVTPRLGLRFNFAAPARSALLGNGQYDNDDIDNGFALSFALENGRLSFVHDWDLRGHFGFNAEVGAEDHALMGISAFASPFLSLVGSGDGAVVAEELGEDTFSIRLGFASDRLSQSDNDGRDANVWVGEVIGRLPNGSWVGLQFGRTLEGNRLLGSEGNGAFELPPTSTTHFTTLAGMLYLNDTLELFGQASIGFTEPAGSADGLLKNVSELRSSSFGVGTAYRELLAANDRFTVALSQPLRVDAGTAVFDRGVGWTLDGRILRDRERISLEPEGREIDIEVAYLFPLGSNASMSVNWLSQLEPGHDREASPAHALAIKLRAKF